MRYYRMGERLIATDGQGSWDLSAATAPIPDLVTLAEAAALAGESIDHIARRACSEETKLSLADPEARARRPIDPDEIWAAGVTYHISETARTSESSLPDVYTGVYGADRPELFFKATASRTVGPREAIGIRGDSDWNVPEPELGIVLYRDRIIGYTIGNDVSSRAIEGENPLYLPQAKIYDRSCAIGPCVVSAADIDDPQDLHLSMRVQRDDQIIYEESTSTAELVRTPNELVSYYAAHNVLPRLSVLLTGTGLVPPDAFTLEPEDEVAIDIQEIGTLENVVVTV